LNLWLKVDICIDEKLLHVVEILIEYYETLSEVKLKVWKALKSEDDEKDPGVPRASELLFNEGQFEMIELMKSG
jgi:hypothetical protein